MTWKGIVSHDGHATMTARHPVASATQARSSWLGDSQPVTRMPHGLDRGFGAKLLAEPPDANVDHVRSGIEAVAPDLREEPFAAHDLARMCDEVVEQAELSVREIRDAVIDASLAPREVELESRDADRRCVLAASVAQLDAHARNELVERERLREIVVRPELEAPQLRRQVGSRGEDQHRQLGPAAVELVEQS